LPWGVWALLRFLQRGKASDAVLLLLVNLLGLSQAHVPSVFIPYAMLLGFILFCHLFTKSRHQLTRVITAGLILFALNALWGLPYVYSALNKSAEISASRINHFSTNEIFFRNLAWGDLRSVFTYGGFNLDYYDWNGQKFDFMMGQWRALYYSLPYQIISLLFSAIAVLGAVGTAVLSWKKRRGYFVPFLIGWVLNWLGLFPDDACK
jgi:hypothetical protein